MKVVYTGLPFFGQKLVDQLNQFDPSNTYLFYDTYSSYFDQLKFLFASLNADLIVSFNGAYSSSKSLDYALLLKKAIMMQWHGTDVLNAKDNYMSGHLNKKYIDKAIHFTDSNDLHKELKSIDIESSILHFKYLEKVRVKRKKELKVLSYVAENRGEFYGINTIKKIAINHPEIKFNIAGIRIYEEELPNNIVLLGWVTKEDFNTLLSESSIFLRLTQHDGLSLSVLEAIAFRCHVLWTCESEACVHVKSERDTMVKFDELVNEILLNNCLENSKGESWLKDTFSKEKVLTNYINKLKEIVG